MSDRSAAASVGRWPERDETEVLAEMERRADCEGFPTVGPAVDWFLRFLVEMIGATRIFECGSGLCNCYRIQYL